MASWPPSWAAIAGIGIGNGVVVKDVPEPAGQPHHSRNLMFGVLGVVGAGALWFTTGATQLGAVVAPVLGALAAIPLLNRVLPARLATPE